jgi:hypothetical protein
MAKIKKNESQLILTDVCNRAYAMIATAQKELAALNLSQEEMGSTENTQRIATAKYLLSLTTVISDILSPAFDISLQLCDKSNHAFIEQIKARYALVLEAEKNRKEQAAKVAEEFKVVMEDEQK